MYQLRMLIGLFLFGFLGFVSAAPSRRSYGPGRLALRNNTGPNPYCSSDDQPPIFTYGDIDSGGPGVLLRDADFTNLEQSHYYFFYENDRDHHPWKYVLLTPGSEVFISVCPTFAGRIDGPPTRTAWGDVSLLEGCDGAAVIAATDGSGAMAGFSLDIVRGAPDEALTAKTDGSPVLAKTVGDYANNDTIDYELGLLSPVTQAFIVQAYKPVISTMNGRWEITLYSGTY
ncbi:hypothetical protein GQ53DRAFT_832508 [Thozetella sp. PMI_491]|nr:hypothetical protein GQ53DRAFT_832508 [Thozetella sp. PMI_491]